MKKWQVLIEGRGLFEFEGPDEEQKAIEVAIELFDIDEEIERFGIEEVKEEQENKRKA